ncbi:hypothetical protein D3C87_914890 [compost metagenome]
MFKSIVSIPGYSVDEAGVVINDKTKKVQKQYMQNGYVKVNILSKHYNVHRLVAAAFIGAAPPGRDKVNHKDGNKLNNHYTNLEWVSHSENIRHAFSTGLCVPDRSSSKPKPVRRLDPAGILPPVDYKSITSAAISNDASVSCILRCTRGELKTSGGFIWTLI